MTLCYYLGSLTILNIVCFTLFVLYMLIISEKKKTTWHQSRSENKEYESQWYQAKQNMTTDLTKEKFIKFRKE